MKLEKYKAIVFDLGGTLMEYEGMPLDWSDYYYQRDTFLEDEIYELQNIARKLSEMTNGEFLLICKKFMLTDDEIIYEDDFQVVITPEVYKRHNRNNRFKLLSEIEVR